MPLKAREISDTVYRGKDPKETYMKVIEDIGRHFIDNAQRYAENIVDVHAGMKIEIDIPINEIVSLSVKYDEYVKKSEGK